MAWQDEMTLVLRNLISDVATTPTYTDDRLQQLLVISAMQVELEMTFSQTFKTDINNVDITPDPTDDAGQTRDDSFINLSCLKAACILDRGEAKIAASQAIQAVDGRSSVNLTGIAASKLKLLEKGWCAVYEDAKIEYLSGQVRVAGAAVMTPFRVWADGGYMPRTPGRDRDIFY